MKLTKKQEITIVLDTESDLINMRMVCALAYTKLHQHQSDTKDPDFEIAYLSHRLGANFNGMKEFIDMIFWNVRDEMGWGIKKDA